MAITSKLPLESESWQPTTTNPVTGQGLPNGIDIIITLEVAHIRPDIRLSNRIAQFLEKRRSMPEAKANGGLQTGPLNPTNKEQITWSLGLGIRHVGVGTLAWA